MNDSWITPANLYADLNKEFHFCMDPCPLFRADNLWFDKNGLTERWFGSVFVNPPFSKPRPWIVKAIEETKGGATCVLLLKGDPSTSWFHDLILPFCEIRWIRGRVQYIKPNGEASRCPFPSMIVIPRAYRLGPL